MALNEIQQITELLKKSHHILITFKKDYSADAVSSALALYLFLQKISQKSSKEFGGEKLVDIICDNFTLPKNLKFLEKADMISEKINNLQKFIISVNINGNDIDEFSYDLEGEKLNIYITPKNGALKAEEITAENSAFKYDLVITLDTPDLNSLGKIYQNSTDFFYNTNIINIDHQPENEHYGQINFTNLNAVSTTEIIYNLISGIDKNLIDKNIATCILTGLIAETKSFKTPNVTPKTLEIAGQLMALEADRETIIKSLYRNRSLATLKLWGRVLARLKNEDNNKLVWSILTDHDFMEANADENDLPEVIEEIISFIPGVETAVLIYQHGHKNCVLVNTLKNNNALYLTKEFKSTGSKDLAEFCIVDRTLLETEKEVIEKIKQNLSKI